jgi:spore photoproduct lyase
MSDQRKKNREAALKAWVTIRKNRREKAAKGVEKLDKWKTVKALPKIQHPEEILQEISQEWEGNGVVKLFKKTPNDIACGPFWEIRWAFGCPLNCSYCYLRGTMRGNMKQSYVKYEEIERCLNEAFMKIELPQIFNSGELCDSLMNPILMDKITNIFNNQNKHKIFLLSKFGLEKIGFLLDNHKNQTICAWSINADAVAKKWETNAAKPLERIKAASLVWEEGYDTRVRIDPIFPINGWKEHYSKLIDDIFSSFLPNRIILGTPRGLWKTINYAQKANVDMSWAEYFEDDSSWGKKLSFKNRKEIYSFIYNKLDSLNYPIHKISICKETTEMWESLGLESKKRICNCYGTNAYKA